MSAFLHEEIFGEIQLVDMPPLKPSGTHKKTLVSGGEPELIGFAGDTKYLEIKIKTLGATSDDPDVNFIFDGGTISFGRGLWTRFKNVEQVQISYADGGSAIVEIREF